MIAVKYDTVSTGEAARLTGVSIKKILYWQDQGYIPEPERVVCGERAYRQFSHSDLENIKTIKSYMDEGYTLRAAARKATEKGRKL